MKFLVDAQLPRRLARWLQSAGLDVLHTLDLPDRNQTTDAAINALAVRDGRIVVINEVDFVNSHLLYGRLPQLLVVSTGNIKNADLEAVFAAHHVKIIAGFQTGDYIELTRTNLVVHI